MSLTNAFFGSIPISKAFYGSNLIFDKEPETVESMDFTIQFNENSEGIAGLYINLDTEDPNWRLETGDGVIAADANGAYSPNHTFVPKSVNNRNYIYIRNLEGKTLKYRFIGKISVLTFLSAGTYNDILGGIITVNKMSEDILKTEFKVFNYDYVIPASLPKSNTNLDGMFENSVQMSTDLSHWDTSHVVTMRSTFRKCKVFNSPLASWDLSNCVEITEMLLGCENFNQPIDTWDVSKVTKMVGTFRECYKFNQPLNSWNTASLTSLESTFYDAAVFNQDLNLWDTSNVTDTRWAFAGATAFNGDISTWDTHNVTLMNSTFFKAAKFNCNISQWETSKVYSTAFMFDGAFAFNQPIGDWDMGRVQLTRYMFRDAKAFNKPLSNWSLASCSDMEGMFIAATGFNQDISSWCVPLVKSTPPYFSDSTPQWTASKPVWGTCPLPNVTNFLPIDITGASGVFLTISKNSGPDVTFNIADPTFDFAAFSMFVGSNGNQTGISFLAYPDVKAPNERVAIYPFGIAGIKIDGTVSIPEKPSGYTPRNSLQLSPTIIVEPPFTLVPEVNTLALKRTPTAPPGYDIYDSVPNSTPGAPIVITSNAYLEIGS